MRCATASEQPHTRGPGRLNMGHDAGDGGLAGNVDDLLDGRHEAGRVVALVADVTGVEAAVLADHAAQLDHLRDVREGARHIEEPAREAERPLLHAGAHQLAHALDLLRGGVPVLLAHDLRAHRVVPDHLADVEAHAVPEERLALRREAHRAAAVRVDHHRREALRQQGPAVRQLRRGQPLARVVVHVDEARRDGEPAGVDPPLGLHVVQVADRGDPVASHGDVGPDPGRARAVVDEAVLDDEVGRLGSIADRLGGEGGRQARGAERDDETGQRVAHRGILPWQARPSTRGLWPRQDRRRRGSVSITRRRLPSQLPVTGIMAGARRRVRRPRAASGSDGDGATPTLTPRPSPRPRRLRSTARR